MSSFSREQGPQCASTCRLQRDQPLHLGPFLPWDVASFPQPSQQETRDPSPAGIRLSLAQLTRGFGSQDVASDRRRGGASVRA